MATMSAVWDRAAEFLSDNLATVAPLMLLTMFVPLAAAHGLSAMDAGDPTEALQASNAKLFVVLYLPIIGLVLLWLSARVQWKLAGVVLLYPIVSQVAAYAAQTVFGSLLHLAFGGEGRSTVASVLTAIIVAAISTLFSLLAIAFTARLYRAACDARHLVVDGAPPKGSVPGK